MTSSLSLHCRSLFPPTFFIQLQQICTLSLPLSSSNIFLSLFLPIHSLLLISSLPLSLPPSPATFLIQSQQICTLSLSSANLHSHPLLLLCFCHSRSCCVSAIAAAALLSRCCSSSRQLLLLSRICH